ncbi:MAG: hypothetical protein U0235_05600 [Polyangiaceae bacterium]
MLLRRSRFRRASQPPPSVPASVRGPSSATIPVRYRRRFELLPLAPAVVILIGVLAAIVIGIVGTTQLESEGNAQAATRSKILAATLAARLRALPESVRLDAMQLAARRTGALFVLADGKGQVALDAGLGAPPKDVLARMLDVGEGETETAIGPARFAVHWLGVGSKQAVVAFVRSPRTGGASALSSPRSRRSRRSSWARPQSSPTVSPATRTSTSSSSPSACAACRK